MIECSTVEVLYCMRRLGVAEKYVGLLQDMYEGNVSVMRCVVGVTDGFKVEMGLVLSHSSHAFVMDRLTDEIRQESPWTMMFVDDIVICSLSREEVEESLERWGQSLERRGIKVRRSKMEYICMDGMEGSVMVTVAVVE